MKKIIFYIYKKCWDIIANPTWHLLVQSVMHINLHYLRLIFPEAQAFIKVLVTQFHSEAAVLAWA